MTTMTEAKIVQVYRVYIRATPEAIWTAITDPEWSNRYGYGGRAEYDLRRSARASPSALQRSIIRLMSTHK